MSAFLSPQQLACVVNGTWHGDAMQSLGLATDTRDNVRGKVFVAMRGERFDGHDCLEQAREGGAHCAVVSRLVPGVDIAQLVVADTQEALTALGRAWRGEIAARVIGVTGSAGKTTTHRLIAAAMETVGSVCASPKSFNNHIGVPFTICQCPRDCSFLVAEIGTNHPGEIATLSSIVRPHIAVITNAGRVHLEGLGSVSGVIAEKSSIASHLEDGGVAIVPGDSPDLIAAVRARCESMILFGMVPESRDTVALISRSPMGAEQRCTVSVFGERIEFHLSLAGEHNAKNACAALAAACAAGADPRKAAAALSRVVAKDMRLVPSRAGEYELINDAYNANPEAMVASMAAFAEMMPSHRRVVVLGEMGELGPDGPAMHAEVGTVAAKHAAVAIFVGPLTRHGAEAAQRAGTCEVVHVQALDGSGIEAILASLQKNDAILVKGSRGAAMERFVEALVATNSTTHSLEIGTR
ncbi:MAG: UDP-N-acetylmuramoyl-tripeptide--D-alanyl-D-alanine ligase [Planctomycetota bacterium]|nr:UDP-N-acetylmuramoyl-tripeptide--D-alanyl-D-alanine ligase [Planctomycetota bacterium]